MITILSDDTTQNVGQKLYDRFCEKGVKAEYISIADVNVEPCYSCGGCTDKTFGKCVVRDDADWIFPRLIRSDVMLLVTPVKWGAYSFKTKRVFDKCAVIGNRYYHVKKGELVKGMMGNNCKLYAVGVKDHCSVGEKEVFKELVAENINIMDIQGNSYVVDYDIDDNLTTKMVEEMSL